MGIAYSTSIKIIGPVDELKNLELIGFQYADNGIVPSFVGSDYKSDCKKQVDTNSNMLDDITSETNYWDLEFFGDLFCCLSIDIDSYTVKPPVDDWFKKFDTKKWCLRFSVRTDNPSLYISEIYFGDTNLKYETDRYPFDENNSSFLSSKGFKDRFIKELIRNISL